jgi:hypothetical protein
MYKGFWQRRVHLVYIIYYLLYNIYIFISLFALRRAALGCLGRPVGCGAVRPRRWVSSQVALAGVEPLEGAGPQNGLQMVRWPSPVVSLALALRRG